MVYRIHLHISYQPVISIAGDWFEPDSSPFQIVIGISYDNSAVAYKYPGHL